MVTSLVLSRAPPLVTLLGFLCVRKEERNKICFLKSCSRLTFGLYSGNLWPNNYFFLLIYLFINLLISYLLIKSYGCYQDQLFVVTCFLSNESSESWLIDSGCTNHMTFDRAFFKDLRPTNVTKVRIGNGDYILVKGDNCNHKFYRH